MFRYARTTAQSEEPRMRARSAGRRAVITSSGRRWLRSGLRLQSGGQSAGLYFYTSPPTSRTHYSAAMRYVGSPCVWRAGPARPNRETGHRGGSRSIRLISITVRGRVAVATSTHHPCRYGRRFNGSLAVSAAYRTGVSARQGCCGAPVPSSAQMGRAVPLAVMAGFDDIGFVGGDNGLYPVAASRCCRHRS
jgi:hypothetical protein